MAQLTKPGQSTGTPTTIPITSPRAGDTRRNPYPQRQPFTDAYGQPIEIWEDVGRLTTARRRGRSNAASQAQVGGPGTIIPVHYGLRRVGARIGAVTTYNGLLVLLCVWGEGEIDAVEQLYINDEAAPSGVTATHYLGTAGQTADPTLIAAYAALGASYTDSLANIAYSVVVVPPKKNAGFPQVSARIRGRKVRATEAGAPAYSRVPAYILADFITNARYGLGAQVDWSDVATLATRNTGTIGSPAEARHELSVSVDQLATAEQWLQTLADYAGAIPAKDGEVYRLFPDAPGSSVATLTEGDIVEGSLRWEQRSPADAPTVVEVTYTDTADSPWKDTSVFIYAPGADTGATERRLTRVNRPGIQRHSEAYRYGVQLLNSFQTSDLSVRLDLFDEALRFLPGDVVTVNATPFTSKLFRVMSVAARGRQLWSVVLVEYDAAKWSDAVVNGPSSPDTNLPSPTNVPALTGLAAVEEIYQVQTGLFASRIRASWNSPEATFLYLGGYEVRVLQAGIVVEGPVSVPAGTTSYATGPLEENLAYTFSVSAVSTIGAVGPATSAVVTTNGKTARPSDVPYLFAYEVAGELRFNWSPAADADLTAHELRYGLAAGSWATATLIERVPHPQQTYISRVVPPGAWRFYIKGLDSVRTEMFPFGQESLNARSLDLETGGDPSLFLAGTHTFVAGTLTNMVVERLLGVTRWVTSYGGVWNTIFSSALGTYGNPLHTYSGSGTSSILSDVFDLGQVYSGLFVATPQWTDIVGLAQPTIELSTDNTVWTPYPGLSAQGPARYVRLRIATTGHVIVTSLGQVSVSVATLSESGVVTTATTGPVMVTLERAYSKVKTIQLTADVSAGPANPGYLDVYVSSDPLYVEPDYIDDDYYDDETLPPNVFGVNCYDSSINLIAREVRYTFSGI